MYFLELNLAPLFFLKGKNVPTLCSINYRENKLLIYISLMIDKVKYYIYRSYFHYFTHILCLNPLPIIH